VSSCIHGLGNTSEEPTASRLDRFFAAQHFY
jgi:hypothetical protein